MSDGNDDTNKAPNLYAAADVLNNQKGGKYRAGRKRTKPTKKPLAEGWRAAKGNRGRGHPGFAPTAAERTLVAILSFGILDQPDICTRCAPWPKADRDFNVAQMLSARNFRRRGTRQGDGRPRFL